MLNFNHAIIRFGMFLLLLLPACSQEKLELQETIEEVGSATTKSLSLDMSGVGRTTVSNTEVYVFDEQGMYDHKVLNINRTGDRMSMTIPHGRWDLFLCSADLGVRTDIQTPVSGSNRVAQKMIEFGTWDSSRPSQVVVPEIRTARIDGLAISADQQHTVSASLVRQAAMIKVVVADVMGVAEGFSYHEFQLRNVPNALSWSGSLWPDKDTPQVNATPMRLPVAISTDAATGRQHSDTMTFIVPAHVGTDYMASNPADTSTHKLGIMLRLYTGTDYITKEAELPLVPKANKIIVARLFVKSDLTFQTTIEDWVDTEMSADWDQTTIQVSKTYVEMPWKDTLYVKANKSLNVVPEASWLTTRMLDAERVELIGSVDDYDSPRSTYVNFTAGNVTKRVRVNQRPDRGTINFRPKRVILSPAHPSKDDVYIDCAHAWKLPSSEKVTPSLSSGTGDARLTLTRKTSDKNFSHYGNEYYTVRNMETVDTSRIEVCNLYIDSPDEILIASPRVNADTTFLNNEITVFGASGKFKVLSTPEWMTATVESDGQLKITAQREPNEEAREGMMTIAHVDDPDYTMQIKVLQDIIIRIPEFEYFVVKLTWDKDDADIAAEFANNGGVEFDKKPVGWVLGTTRYYKHYVLLQWGDDAKAGEGETVFFNAPVLNIDDQLPRKINLDIYGSWFTYGRAPAPMTFTMYAYKGGTMEHKGTNYNNVGGTLLYTEQFTVMITTTRGYNIYDTGGYTPVARMTYDRIKHTAHVVVKAATTTKFSTPVPYRLPANVPDEPKPYIEN